MTEILEHVPHAVPPHWEHMEAALKDHVTYLLNVQVLGLLDTYGAVMIRTANLFCDLLEKEARECKTAAEMIQRIGEVRQEILAAAVGVIKASEEAAKVTGG